MKRTTLLFLLVVLVFAVQPLAAQDEAGDASSSTEIVLQLSSLPEAKVQFNYKYKLPFLQGSGPLTEGNNITFKAGAELTPISLGGNAEAVLTPIAFLQFYAGGRLGSGWKAKLGGDLYGIGKNTDVAGISTWEGSAFDGLLWGVHIGGTFQFDFAALFPGEWNHVVLQSSHEFEYSGYTNAKKFESWWMEHDGGENVNGWTYSGNIFVGYQMPIFLDTIGILTEMDINLYVTPYRSDWGDDITFWKFALLSHFTVTERFGAALLVQFRTVRNFDNYKKELYKDPVPDDVYYQIRDFKGSSRLEFYRVAAILSYKL